MSDDMLSQDEIEKLLNKNQDQSDADDSSKEQAAGQADAEKEAGMESAGDDGMMSQDEIEKLLNQQSEQQPDEQPAKEKKEADQAAARDELLGNGEKSGSAAMSPDEIEQTMQKYTRPAAKRRSEAETENGTASPAAKHRVEKVEFPVLSTDVEPDVRSGIDSFRPVRLKVSAELGKTTMKVRDLISLEKGALLKLDRLADENLVLLVNESPLAYGEVVVINDRFGVRITKFVGQEEDDK